MKKYNITLWCLRILLITYISVPLISCKNKDLHISTEKVAYIDLDNLKSAPSIFDFISKIEVIPLDNAKEALMSPQNFLKTTVHNEDLYFLDKKQNSVFVFNKDGSLKKKIERRGNGPGEYIMLTDLNINSYSNTLELLTPQGKVLQYDLLGDNFFGSFELNDSIKSVHMFESLTKDLYVFFSIFNENKIIYFSRNENSILKTEYSTPDFLIKKTLLKFANTPFIKYGDTIRFFEGHSGNIYTVDPKNLTIIPKFRWDMGEYTFDLSKISTNESDMYYYMLAQRITQKYATPFMINSESDRYFVSNFNFKNQKFLSLVFDKSKNCASVFSETKEGIKFLAGDTYDNIMYLCVTYEFLMDNHIINEKILNEDNLRIYRSIKPEDNFIIIKYIFKSLLSH